jgi:hypothetical protein
MLDQVRGVRCMILPPMEAMHHIAFQAAALKVLELRRLSVRHSQDAVCGAAQPAVVGFEIFRTRERFSVECLTVLNCMGVAPRARR